MITALALVQQAKDLKIHLSNCVIVLAICVLVEKIEEKKNTLRALLMTLLYVLTILFSQAKNTSQDTSKTETTEGATLEVTTIHGLCLSKRLEEPSVSAFWLMMKSICISRMITLLPTIPMPLFWLWQSHCLLTQTSEQ